MNFLEICIEMIFRYRGSELSNGYNSNFKKIYKAHVNKSRLQGVHSDPYIKTFYYDSQEWYVPLHDIRTQETHYDLGELIITDDKVIYINKNRNGVSKNIYTNPSEEINLEIQQFLDIVEKFLRSAGDVVKKLEIQYKDKAR